MQPDQILLLYIAASPATVILASRGIAISKAFRRPPRLTEFIFLPGKIQQNDKAWLQSAKIFFWLWLSVMLFAFVKEIPLSEDASKIKKGFFAITAFNIGCIWHALHAIKHHVKSQNSYTSRLEENKDYLNKLHAFPGFKGSLDAAISSGSIVLFILIIMTVLI